MKRGFQQLIAIIALTGLAIGVGSAGTATRLAESTSLPGKFQKNACLTFGEALHRQIQQAGGESHLVVFSWAGNGNRGRHCIVVYLDKEGNYRAIDHRLRRSKKLRGDDAGSWVRQFARGHRATLLFTRNNPRLAGQTAGSSGSLLAQR